MFITYKTNATLNKLLKPEYTGYLTKFNGGNMPENYMKDFPEYTGIRTIKEYSSKEKTEEKQPFAGDFSIEKPSLLIYEKVVLNRRYKSFNCDDPEILKFAVATVICNILPRGSCILAYNFNDYLYDIIYLLKACFSVVNIYQGYIECDEFMLKQKDIDRVLNYLRYALDCPGDIYAFPTQDEKLDSLFSKLFS